MATQAVRARPTGVRLPMPGGPIVVATDGSDDAAVAAIAAAKIDLVLKAGIHVVHCWMAPVTPYGHAGSLDKELERSYAMPAAALLDREVSRLEGRGGRITGSEAIEGPAFELIPDRADQLDAPLIVLGSRGLGAVKRMVLGSVSEGVVRNAHRPVLVVRGGARAWPPRSIIVGDDGSAEARTAALTAASVAAAVGARLRILSVLPTLWTDAASPAEARRAEVARAAAENMLSELATHVAEASGMRPGTAILVGDPGSTLVAEARKNSRPAMVAVGSRGLGPVRRLALGSVSTRVLHTAPASVLICPR